LESLNKRRNLKDLGIDGKIMDHRETGLEDVDWIDLAQDRDQRQALVNTVMNL
jgi:hypothetical protein